MGGWVGVVCLIRLGLAYLPKKALHNIALAERSCLKSPTKLFWNIAVHCLDLYVHFSQGEGGGESGLCKKRKFPGPGMEERGGL